MYNTTNLVCSVGGSTPSKGKRFSSSTLAIPAVEPKQPPSQRVLGWGEVKRQEREADNSRPSSAEVSVWSYTSTSTAACLDGVMLNEAQEQLCFTVSNNLLKKLAT
jgi:hypothetical protein